MNKNNIFSSTTVKGWCWLFSKNSCGNWLTTPTHNHTLPLCSTLVLLLLCSASTVHNMCLRFIYICICMYRKNMSNVPNLYTVQWNNSFTHYIIIEYLNQPDIKYWLKNNLFAPSSLILGNYCFNRIVIFTIYNTTKLTDFYRFSIITSFYK